MPEAKVDRLLAALFPRRCILCDQLAGTLSCCSACRRDLPWITSPCSRCGDLLPADYHDSVCGRCSTISPGLDRVISALVYEYPVDRLVAMAKFHGRADSAYVLGELLANYLRGRLDEGDLSLPDMILPVPLHPSRAAQRGFNQAMEIALPLANTLGVPVRPDVCRRIRETAEQTRLDALSRLKNTRHAFRASEEIAAKHVVVVDDVITTGSTVQSMSIALQEAGVDKVQVWTAARTVGRRSTLRT